MSLAIWMMITVWQPVKRFNRDFDYGTVRGCFLSFSFSFVSFLPFRYGGRKAEIDRSIIVFLFVFVFRTTRP